MFWEKGRKVKLGEGNSQEEGKRSGKGNHYTKSPLEGEEQRGGGKGKPLGGEWGGEFWGGKVLEP